MVKAGNCDTTWLVKDGTKFNAETLNPCDMPYCVANPRLAENCASATSVGENTCVRSATPCV